MTAICEAGVRGNVWLVFFSSTSDCTCNQTHAWVVRFAPEIYAVVRLVVYMCSSWQLYLRHVAHMHSMNEYVEALK